MNTTLYLTRQDEKFISENLVNPINTKNINNSIVNLNNK